MIHLEPTGDGILQLLELGVAFLLSALIGLEREIKQKSAGLRTYTLVGLASALFLLISKYGFTNVLAAGTVVLDPSRVAAQIVSGIGFLGAGVIFVRADAVKGADDGCDDLAYGCRGNGLWSGAAGAGVGDYAGIFHRRCGLPATAANRSWHASW